MITQAVTVYGFTAVNPTNGATEVDVFEDENLRTGGIHAYMCRHGFLINTGVVDPLMMGEAFSRHKNCKICLFERTVHLKGGEILNTLRSIIEARLN